MKLSTAMLAGIALWATLMCSFHFVTKIGCNIYPSIANADKIDTTADEEFGVGDDDINNITEPDVVIKVDNKILDKDKGKRLKDYNLRTCWLGRTNEKSQIDYVFDLSELKDSHMDFNKIIVFNGNRYNSKQWKSTSRIKKLLMSVNGKQKCFLHLANTYKMQTFEISKESVQGGNIIKFTFEIVDVYKNSSNTDIAISELKFE